MRSPTLLARRSIVTLLIAGAVGYMATSSGCLAPAMVASAGLSAAQSGATTWLEGDLVGTFNEMYPDMVWACDAAAEQLALTVRIRRLDPDAFFLYLEDDKGVDIDIQVNKRTERLCQIRVRVGVWGNKPLSALLMNTIERQLAARHGSPEGTEAPRASF